MSDLTRILDQVQQGDPKAAAELLPLVYDELRRVAAARMPPAHRTPAPRPQAPNAASVTANSDNRT